MRCPHHRDGDCPLPAISTAAADAMRRKNPRLSVIVVLVDTEQENHSSLAVSGLKPDLAARFLDEAANAARQLEQAQLARLAQS